MQQRLIRVYPIYPVGMQDQTDGRSCKRLASSCSETAQKNVSPASGDCHNGFIKAPQPCQRWLGRRGHSRPALLERLCGGVMEGGQLMRTISHRVPACNRQILILACFICLSLLVDPSGCVFCGFHLPMRYGKPLTTVDTLPCKVSAVRLRIANGIQIFMTVAILALAQTVRLNSRSLLRPLTLQKSRDHLPASHEQHEIGFRPSTLEALPHLGRYSQERPNPGPE